MPQQPTLFNKRILNRLIHNETYRVSLPKNALAVAKDWADKLDKGRIDQHSESQVEQTFNQRIFGEILGYQQLGETDHASLIVKRTGETGRDTPDFVLGRFGHNADIERWVAVGEVRTPKLILISPKLIAQTRKPPSNKRFVMPLSASPELNGL